MSLQQLPPVPVLPAIEMPESQAQSPSPSFAGSFSTALSSPQDETSPLPPSSLAPPASLRKSISVDSFAQFKENTRTSRPHTANSQDSSRSTANSSTADSEPRPLKPFRFTRTRGESVGAVPIDTPHFDSDVERYDPLASTTSIMERFRRGSLKSQDPHKHSIRGGDLPLPSRAPNTSTSLSASTPTPSQLRDPPPPVPSSSSSSRRSTHQSPGAPASRSRSGSIGISLKPMPTSQTAQTPKPLPTINKDIVLLVIGTSGCGKTTLIKKGLSPYGLAESTEYESPLGSGSARCVHRRATVLVDQSQQNVDVIEVTVNLTNEGLVKWPQGLPPTDGIIICYDQSNKQSFHPVKSLLTGYQPSRSPLVVLGCKADLTHAVSPEEASQMLQAWDTGLIQVSMDKAGKEKMKLSFEFLLKAVLRQRGNSRVLDRNPASPDFLRKGTLWEKNWTTTSITPAAPSPLPSSLISIDTSTVMASSQQSPSSPLSPSIPTLSPSLPKPHYDVLSDSETPRDTADESQKPYVRLDTGDHSSGIPTPRPLPEGRPSVKKEVRPTQWAELDELLDKLLFLAVSGDDPTFTTHFLLTYRRFATPRSVLLAMQKRMRQLDNPCGDPMFACFAQMRICRLLEIWIRDFPHDFAVRGTAGALNALIKSIISKTHLLHYGSEFLPFLEQLPERRDTDAAWALKTEILDNDSEEYTPDDDDDDERTVAALGPRPPQPVTKRTKAEPATSVPRERKASLPPGRSSTTGSQSQDLPPRQLLRDLQAISRDLEKIDSLEVAQEITRNGIKLFLAIQPRDWLHHTFVSPPPENSPLVLFNRMADDLANWVSSLILCYDKPRQRAKQLEKLIEIAQRLRQMNNYSGLRAFVAGIFAAWDETTMDLFGAKCPESMKNLKSWEVLLQQIRSHRAYRLALRNSKGGCIPALEVHIMDLTRAHEGNSDVNEEAPHKIHWGKFNMIGRFIASTMQCQAQCRNCPEYDFPERPYIAELFTRRPSMSEEMRASRKAASSEFDDSYPYQTRESGPPETPGIRRLFFW